MFLKRLECLVLRFVIGCGVLVRSHICVQDIIAKLKAGQDVEIDH